MVTAPAFSHRSPRSAVHGSLSRVRIHTHPFLTRRVLRELGTGRDVLATWWPSVVLGILALLLVLLAVRAGRRRHRWGLALRAVGALVVVSVALAAGVNTYAGYLPSFTAARAWVSGRLSVSQGRVSAVTIPPGAGSGLKPTTTFVYTPAGYRAGSDVRYPVVYLLHGSPGTSVDWFAAGDIAHTLGVLAANHLLPRMIAVAPDLNAPSTDDTECLNSTHPGGPEEATYLDHVVTWTDAHYPTEATPAGRLVAGMSSGGYCALEQGLSQQSLYGGIVALEPYSSPGSGGRAALSTPQQYRAVSPSAYIPQMVFEHPTPTFVDMAGVGSPVSSRDAQLVADELRLRHQPVYLRREAGLPHSWTMASRGASFGLVWTARRMHLRDERGAPTSGRADLSTGSTASRARAHEVHAAALRAVPGSVRARTTLAYRASRGHRATHAMRTPPSRIAVTARWSSPGARHTKRVRASGTTTSNPRAAPSRAVALTQ